MSDASLQELIARVYEAGADPTLWPRFLAGLREALGDRSGELQIYDLEARTGSLVVSHGHDPAAIHDYAAHYATINPWIAAASERMRVGQVLVSDEVLPVRALKRTEFYADFLRRTDVLRSLAAIVGYDATGATAFLAIERSERRGEFHREERELVERLLPHVERSLALHRRLGALRVRGEALAEVVERSPYAMWALDAAHRVTFANREATKLDRQTTSRIVDVARRGGGLVPRADRRALVVTAAPIRLSDPLLGVASRVTLVFAIDPDANRLPPVAWLQTIYGLTPAEARLAVALASGRSLAEIADETRTSITTLRTHVKHVFEKTGTRRQAELVRLIMSSNPIA